MELNGVEVSDPVRQAQERVREGDIYDYHHEYEKAIISYDNALQIDPDCADAWFNKAITLNKIKRHSEATRCVAIALNLYVGKN